jgi:Na+:H+ antiporter, NhaA family
VTASSDSSPRGPLVVLLRPLLRFFALESSSAIVLLTAAVAAFAWANVAPNAYQLAFGQRLGFTDLRTAINEGLMTLFFFVVGMEIKRELVAGELSTFGQAMLPGIAAIGGMALPALIYLALNWSGPGRSGWGVPIATDIAFCIGVLTLLKRRVPRALLVFVTALAIFDDIGGIIVIALFYGHGLHIAWLAAAAIPAAASVILGRRGSSGGFVYGICGVALWYALHRSGIHATIAGVWLGLSIPTTLQAAGAESPLQRFTDLFHPWVAFVIMPLFALANSGVSLASITWSDVASPVALGVALGLVLGKLIGIFIFAAAAVLLRVAPIPGGAGWAKLLGASAIAGIGFTVALFIAALAFDAPHLLLQAKVGIVIGSVGAALVGTAVLRATHPSADPSETARSD